MRNYLSVLAIIGLSVFISLESTAQNDRSFIRENIEKYGECKNVAITEYNGDVMLYGDNGWAASNCPADLTEALHELNDDGETINDVQLTEDGHWIILYGGNGCTWNNIPDDLEEQIRQYNSDREVITSITFNDNGDWILISEEHISASDSRILDWISSGMEDYGQVWAACVTNDAKVVVFERGYIFDGDVPESLISELKSTTLDVYRIKIAGTAWFYADKEGNYNYYM